MITGGASDVNDALIFDSKYKCPVENAVRCIRDRVIIHSSTGGFETVKKLTYDL